MKYQKEDIVRLKCGSCNMIVETTDTIYSNEKDRYAVICVWMDLNNVNHRVKFMPWVLELVSRPGKPL